LQYPLVNMINYDSARTNQQNDELRTYGTPTVNHDMHFIVLQEQLRNNMETTEAKVLFVNNDIASLR